MPYGIANIWLVTQRMLVDTCSLLKSMHILCTVSASCVYRMVKALLATAYLLSHMLYMICYA